MAGKAQRKRQREKRKLARQARKAARQAIWDALKGTGKNKKKRHGRESGEHVVFARILTQVKVKIKVVWTTALRKAHGGPECGNIGCKRCSFIWKI